MILANSVETIAQPKGSLFTKSTFNGQVSFYTRLQLATKDDIKLITVKIDPSAQVMKIPLSWYLLFPHKIDDSRYPKLNSLCPTAHTWVLHDSLPKPFLGHFIAAVQHTTKPRSYPTQFTILRTQLPPKSCSPMQHQRD